VISNATENDLPADLAERHSDVINRESQQL